jgi:hypothetical protein
MNVATAMMSVPKPAPDLIEAFRNAPTAIVSDNLARLPGAVGLRPFHRGGRLVGAAFRGVALARPLWYEAAKPPRTSRGASVP